MERKDWKGQYKMVKLNEVCRASSSNIILKNIKEKTGDYPVYGASGYIQNIDSYHCNEPYIGIIKDGAGVGKVEIYPAYSSLLGTMQYIHASEKVDLRYIYYKLRSLDFTKYINGAAIPHIYFKDYGQEIIPVPPLPVQARIVDELDCLQGILSKKRQQLAEYHSLAQAIFHQMFGDPVVNEKGWEVKRLGEVAPKRKNAVIVQTYNNKVWLLNLDKIQPHTGTITEKEYLSIEEVGSSVNQFSKDDILYSKLRPYLNKVVIPNSSGYCTSELIPLTPNPIYLNKTYLAYLLRNTSFVDFISGKVAGAKMPRVVISSLTSFETPLPPIKLQEKFAELINAIDNQCELLALSIHETEDLLACRMETLLACRMETLLNCPQA